MISRGSRLGKVSALVLTVGLAGCSGGSEASPRTSTVTVTPTTSAAPSPSASPSPTLPAAAQQPTRAGAEAFAEHFFAVYNHAFWVADPIPMQVISDAECVFCKSTIDAVEAIRKAGDHAEGGRIEVLEAAAAPNQPPTRVIVNVLLHQRSGRTLSAAGAVLDITPERKNGRIDLVIRSINGRWLVLEADVKRNGES